VLEQPVVILPVIHCRCCRSGYTQHVSKNNRGECDVSETVHELVIVRLSLMSGSVTGGEDMIILCEKVKKGDQLILTSYCSYFFSFVRLW